MYLEFNVLLNKSNVNGITYDTDSYLKALDKYILEDGNVYNIYDKDINNVDNFIVGKIKSYSINNNIVICDIELINNIEYDFTNVMLVNSLFGDLNNNIAIIEGFERIYTDKDSTFNIDCKNYYRNLRR
jgi:hypothetical protein